VVEERDASGVSEAQIRDTLADFRGEQQQLPPMYSAIKHKGERLYNLARKGIEVEREPRTIHIHALELLSCELPEFELDVHCSKGTYVRTLAEDIGKALGCGAYVSGLRRTGVGPYDGAEMVTLAELKEAWQERRFDEMDQMLLPLESALENWPEVVLSPDMLFYLRQGQPILVPKAPTEGWVRLYANGDEFIGVGQILDDGRVAPKRMMQAAN